MRNMKNKALAIVLTLVLTIGSLSGISRVDSQAEDTHKTLTFSDWGMADGDYSGAGLYLLQDTTITSLNGCAFEGIVDFNGAADGNTNLRIGTSPDPGNDPSYPFRGLGLWSEGSSYLQLYNFVNDADGTSTFSPQGWTNSGKIKLRLTFDETATNTWSVGVWVNDAYVGEKNLTNTALGTQFLFMTSGSSTIYFESVEEGEVEETPILTFSDWGITSDTYHQGAEYTLQNSTIASLNGYTFEGIVNFKGATSGQTAFMKIGGADNAHVALQIWPEGDTKLKLFNHINVSNPEVVFTPEGWSNSGDMRLRLTFVETAANTWTIGVWVNGIYQGDMNLTDTVLGTKMIFLGDIGIRDNASDDNEEEEPENQNVKVFDFNGTDFDTSLTAEETADGGTGLNAAFLATKLADTNSVPSGFTDGVYAGTGQSGYISVPVAISDTVVQSQVESIKVRMWLGTEASATNSQFRIGADKNLTGYKGVTYAEVGGTCGTWCDVDITTAVLGNTSLWNAGKLQRFVLALRVKSASGGAANVTAYFDQIMIEYAEAQEPTEYKALTFKDWGIVDGAYSVHHEYRLQDTTITSLDGYALEGFMNFNGAVDGTKVDIRLGGNTAVSGNPYLALQIMASGPSKFAIYNHINTADGQTSFTPDGWCNDRDMFVRLTFDETSKDTWKLALYVDGAYAGETILTNTKLGTSLLFFEGVTIKDAGSQPVYKKVAFSGLAEQSGYVETEGKWEIYPLPTSPAAIPGTAGETAFDVAYVITDPTNQETSYEGAIMRADDTKGLCLELPSVQLPREANGYTVTLKAGEYASNDQSVGIHILEDYDICVVEGNLVLGFDFNNPLFTQSFISDLNESIYTITDADTVSINGKTYNKGDVLNQAGDYTIVYSKYGHIYERKVVLYYPCDSNVDNSIDLKDLVAIKKYVAKQTMPTEAGFLASDITCNQQVSVDDVDILRQYLLANNIALPFSPVGGMEAAQAGDAVAELIWNYTPGKSDAIKTGEDLYHRKVTTLRWFSDLEEATYTVHVSTNADMTKSATYVTDVCELELINLLADTDYFWTVSSGDYVSKVQTFHTADTVRTLTIEGVTNTRDGGGWETIDGKRIKQGMYYRGGYVEDITEAGRKVMLEELGIKTDLDLRGAEGRIASPLSADINYRAFSAPYYWGTSTGIGPDMTDAYKGALANAIRTFADEDNYPIYVHCALGRDRTGTVCFLINALCGATEEALYLDYEMSLLSSSTDTDTYAATMVNGNFAALYNNILTYAPAGGTIKEGAENYLINRLGITEAEITSIRELLLED